MCINHAPYCLLLIRRDVCLRQTLFTLDRQVERTACSLIPAGGFISSTDFYVHLEFLQRVLLERRAANAFFGIAVPTLMPLQKSGGGKFSAETSEGINLIY